MTPTQEVIAAIAFGVTSAILGWFHGRSVGRKHARRKKP